MFEFKQNNLHVYAFSDTHDSHRQLHVPENIDILICAGDAVEDDMKGGEYDDFIEWFSSQSAKWKLFVPGNHELSFELGQAEDIVRQMNDNGIIVLEDAIEDCDGVVVASISANSRIEDSNIPTGIDILVTHQPPYGILDENMGSLEILNFALKSKPKYHLFGHIHSTAGQSLRHGYTEFVNISVP